MAGDTFASFRVQGMAGVLVQIRRVVELAMTLGAHPIGLAAEEQGGWVRPGVIVMRIVA
jgi:hypothetical protein